MLNSIFMNRVKSVAEVWRNRFLFQVVTLKRIQHRQKLKRTFRGTSCRLPFPYDYSGGIYTTKFMAGLKQKKLLASACTHCGTIQVPCRMICGRCLKKMEKFVELKGSSGGPTERNKESPRPFALRSYREASAEFSALILSPQAS